MVGLFKYPKRKLKKLVKDGEYKEAIEFGNSLKEKFSDDPDYYFIMGSIYYILEDNKMAKSYLEKAIHHGELDEEALMLKANIHLSLKEPESVRECCNQILDINPKNKDAKRILDELESH